MTWPQWAIIALWVTDLVYTGYHHGEKKTDRHNLGVTVSAVAINVWLLYMGGFFGGRA